MVGPSQFLPPHRGAGLSQDLERHKQELTPSTASSLLQGCHGAQGPKPPLVVWFRSWTKKQTLVMRFSSALPEVISHGRRQTAVTSAEHLSP